MKTGLLCQAKTGLKQVAPQFFLARTWVNPLRGFIRPALRVTWINARHDMDTHASSHRKQQSCSGWADEAITPLKGGYVLKLADQNDPVPEKGSPVHQSIEQQDTEGRVGEALGRPSSLFP